MSNDIELPDLPTAFGHIHDANGNQPLSFERGPVPMHRAITCSARNVFSNLCMTEFARSAILADREKRAQAAQPTVAWLVGTTVYDDISMARWDVQYAEHGYPIQELVVRATEASKPVSCGKQTERTWISEDGTQVTAGAGAPIPVPVQAEAPTASNAERELLEAELDRRGDDKGQGLDPYWKKAFREGWHTRAALATQQEAQPQAERGDPAEPMDDSDRLKPCPFCGSEAEGCTIPSDHPDAGAMFVQCTNSRCMASSALIYPLMDDPKPLLLERWNRRAAQAEPAGGDKEDADRLHKLLIIQHAESVELWNALKDLSFECDGVTHTVAPSRETYNRTFGVLQSKPHLSPQALSGYGSARAAQQATGERT